jgi:hypothetical protein
MDPFSSDRQDNMFVNPPDLISDNKLNKNAPGGALHQSLASFQKKHIQVGVYGSDMKLNLDSNNNLRNDDSILSFKKNTYSNVP